MCEPIASPSLSTGHFRAGSASIRHAGPTATVDRQRWAAREPDLVTSNPDGLVQYDTNAFSLECVAIPGDSGGPIGSGPTWLGLISQSTVTPNSATEPCGIGFFTTGSKTDEVDALTAGTVYLPGEY